MKQIVVMPLILLLLAGVACSGNKTERQAGGGSQTSSGVELGGQPVTLAGIRFQPPSSWNDLGPSGMRKADYAFGPVEGDTDSATVSVYYFGPSSGGGVMDNIERWINQMTMPDGTNPGSHASQNTITVDGMQLHTVELSGTYDASMGGPMSGESVAKPNYHLTAAVLEGPEGNVFFKLTGPEKTAEVMTQGFMAMVKNIKKVSSPSM